MRGRNHAQKTHSSDFSATKNLIHIAKASMQNGACIFIKLKHTLTFIILDFLSQIYSNTKSNDIQSKNHLAHIKVFEMIFN